jgi:hypothetical protein
MSLTTSVSERRRHEYPSGKRGRRLAARARVGTALAAVVAFGMLLAGCGSVRGTGKPLLEKTPPQNDASKASLEPEVAERGM